MHGAARLATVFIGLPAGRLEPVIKCLIPCRSLHAPPRNESEPSPVCAPVIKYLISQELAKVLHKIGVGDGTWKKLSRDVGTWPGQQIVWRLVDPAAVNPAKPPAPRELQTRAGHWGELIKYLINHEPSWTWRHRSRAAQARGERWNPGQISCGAWHALQPTRFGVPSSPCHRRSGLQALQCTY